MINFDDVKKNAKFVSYNERILTCKETRFSNETHNNHTHDFYEVAYIIDGKGIGVVNGKSHILDSGSVSIILPREKHIYYPTGKLSITSISILPTASQKTILNNLKFYHFNLNGELREEYEALFKLLELSLSTKTTTIQARSEIYLNTILNLILNANPDDSNIPEKWAQLFSYISDNYNTVTLKEAAKICNISEEYFCREFKRNFSKTFTEFLDNIKVEKAKNLLSTTDINVENVSQIVGFSHATRFYRKFRDYTGKTPHQFRNSLKLNDI